LQPRAAHVRLRWKSDLFTTLTRSRSIGGRARTLPALPSAVSAVRRRRGRGKSCRSRAGKHEYRHEADYHFPHPRTPPFAMHARERPIWGERTINLCPALGQHNPFPCKISQRSDQMGDEVTHWGARDAFPPVDRTLRVRSAGRVPGPPCFDSDPATSG
jgi:hypothetical protein